MSIHETAYVHASAVVEDGAVVAVDGENGFSGRDVPKDDFPVVAGGGQEFAVGGEFGVVEDIAVLATELNLCGRIEFP